MKAPCHYICVCFLLAGSVAAQTPITLSITNYPGYLVPTNFNGLSFGTISLKPGSNGYFFDSSDTQMVTLFQQLGTRSLRIGGTSVDTNNSDYTPATPDVDALFRFANATGIKVIYSVQLENGIPSQDATMASYLWNNYRQYLDCFAIGNEPNNYGASDPSISNFSSYLAQWNSFADVITNLVPDAVFGGPDGDSSSTGKSWGTQFASAEANSRTVTAIQFHDYVGGSSANLTVQQIIDEVLSTNWDAITNPAEYTACGSPVASLGMPYRFTEANSYYTGGSAGVSGGNNCFATALFSLDFMHWWAMFNCQMACFHTSMWKYNGVFYPDSNGNYQVYPVGYGIKAFDLGGHGYVMPLGILNTNGLNLTAYAVADTTNLYVTLINKENDVNARNAAVTLQLAGFVPETAAVMYLTAPNNDPSATSGITLGGAAITNNGPWQGQWTTLGITNGQCLVPVSACSAAIVKMAVAPASPLIVAQTPGTSSTIMVYPEGDPSLSVSISGNGLVNCQWFCNNMPIPGATNAIYFPPAGSPGVTNQYNCVVSNFVGSVTSLVWSVSVLPVPLASYPQAVLALHPVGYWRLSETPNNASGNQGVICHDNVAGNNGVYSNTVLVQTGYNPASDPSGTAAAFGSFLSSNSMACWIGDLDFSAPVGGSPEFSVMAWVKCSPQSGGGAIIAKGYGNGGEQFVLDFGTGGSNHDFRFFVRNAAGTSVNANSTIQPDGNWHHLVGVCDESNGLLHFYIDDVDRADAVIAAGSGIQIAKAGAAGLGDNLLSIGARTSSSTTTAYNLQTVGTIDEVALYNYALSSSQVASLYATAPVPAINLVPAVSAPVITYTGTLLSSTNLAGPFLPVSGASWPAYTIPYTNSQMFYRVRAN